MSRYLCVIALMAAFGCKTTGEGVGSVLPSTSNQTPAALKPILAAPKERAPAIAATSPVVVPLVAPAPMSAEMEPARVSLPVATVSDDAQTSLRATRDSAVHEVSAVLAELLSMAKSLPSFGEPSLRASAANADSKRPVPTADERSSQQRLSASPPLVWSYAAPILTGLCVYILAPLLVDLLKQRMQFVRREVDAAKTT